MLVDHEVGLKLLRVHAFGAHLVYLLLIVVDALAAGSHLHAPEQQVEGQGVLGVFRVVHGVEGPLFHRIMGDKDKVGAVLFLEIPADVLLLLRLQIVGVSDGAAVFGAGQLFGLFEGDHGDMLHIGQLDAQSLQIGGVVLFQQFHGVAEEAGLHLDDIVKGGDIPHLKVHGGVFVQVPGGGVLLCPEDGSDLKDPLIDAYHHLLIKLGRLPQKGLAGKVLQTEDVAAALGAGVDDLGGVDLGKALPLQIFPEGPAQSGLNLEHRPLFQVPQDHRPQTQLGVQIEGQLPLIHRHRHGLRRAGEDLNAADMDFHAAGGTLFLPQNAGDNDGGLLRDAGNVHCTVTHALQNAVLLPQGEEGEPASHGAVGVYGAVYRDLLAEISAAFQLCQLQSAGLCDSCDKFHFRLLLSFGA